MALARFHFLPTQILKISQKGELRMPLALSSANTYLWRCTVLHIHVTFLIPRNMLKLFQIPFGYLLPQVLFIYLFIYFILNNHHLTSSSKVSTVSGSCTGNQLLQIVFKKQTNKQQKWRKAIVIFAMSLSKVKQTKLVTKETFFLGTRNAGSLHMQ